MRLPYAAAALLAALSLASASLAYAQQNHDAGHPSYQYWRNQKGIACCDGMDCGTIEDADVQFDGPQAKVRIEGTWCPVDASMYLSKGNAPDWSHNHVCVRPDAPGLVDHTPCGRLLCFQPKPGT